MAMGHTGDDENLQNQLVVMIAQPCLYTKTH